MRTLAACVRLPERVRATDNYPVHWPDDPSRWLSPRGLMCAWVAEVDRTIVGHVVLHTVGADRVEIFTGPYAHAFDAGAPDHELARCATLARRAAVEARGGSLTGMATLRSERRGRTAMLDIARRGASRV